MVKLIEIFNSNNSNMTSLNLLRRLMNGALRNFSTSFLVSVNSLRGWNQSNIISS
jgi:hypothetical protein